MQHAAAVANWMKHLGPDAFVSGIMHSIFVGFRPMLVRQTLYDDRYPTMSDTWQMISAIQKREITFLAQDTWTSIPFEGRPLPLMQALCNKALSIPGLLERYTETIQQGVNGEHTTLETLYKDFDKVLRDFRSWEARAVGLSQGPLFWEKFADHPHSPPAERTLWFPDVMTANSLTYCWAFQIIALTHLDHIHTAIDQSRGCNMQPSADKVPRSRNEDTIFKLAEWISDSMSYMMQPEMRLWGPASTFFTFTTAMQVFRRDEERCRIQLSRCRRTIERLADMRINFPGT